jgi:hypothetical protein
VPVANRGACLIVLLVMHCQHEQINQEGVGTDLLRRLEDVHRLPVGGTHIRGGRESAVDVELVNQWDRGITGSGPTSSVEFAK